MIPEIEKLYVYDHKQFGLKVGYKTLDSKVQNTHYRYKRLNVPEKSDEKEIIRFAQTFKIYNTEKTLMFITKNHDHDMAEKFMEQSIIDIMGNEEYLDIFTKVQKTPKSINIYYEY